MDSISKFEFLPLGQPLFLLLEIRHLTRSAIDEKAWDTCVEKNGKGLPYALSGYLDQVTSGKWEALIAADYQYIFPLPYEKKLGQKFYLQPFLTQQLGLFGPAPSAEILTLFLEHIPNDFALLHLKCQEDNPLLQLPSFEFSTRTNLLLSLREDYEVIQAAYSKSLRKRIKQAREQYILQTYNEPKKIAAFYRKELEHRVQLGGHKYELAQKLMQYLIDQDMGFGIAAVKEGKIGACLFLANYRGRLINLFGASNQAGRSSYAMHFLLDAVIRQGAREKNYLDFEGSDIPGVQEFYLSFGAQRKNYLEVQKNQTPLWYRFLQKMKPS